MKDRIGPTEFLRTLAPDFCWCTWLDLFLMYEQIDEDYPEHSFVVTLAKMKKEGVFIVKPRYPGQTPYRNSAMLYLRVFQTRPPPDIVSFHVTTHQTKETMHER